MRACFFLIAAALSAACSSSESSGAPASDASTNVDGATPSDDGATPSDGSGPGDDGAAPSDGATGDSGAAIPLCQQTCSTAADCATASAAYDADNYACEGGICRWKGCNSDEECKSSFASSAYACRTVSGVKQCVKACASASDCSMGSAAYDADNYACEAGSCRWIGCNTDAECASSFASSDYVCRSLPGGFDPLTPTPGKYCLKACATASDCATASAAYDEDNYACESGLCKYVGCKSDGECQSAFMKPSYACR